jgi:hypothetical protein
MLRDILTADPGTDAGIAHLEDILDGIELWACDEVADQIIFICKFMVRVGMRRLGVGLLDALRAFWRLLEPAPEPVVYGRLGDESKPSTPLERLTIHALPAPPRLGSGRSTASLKVA